MKKHAVPQNLMDIEFKLFGSLTVRQFAYVALTFVLALLVYFSGLPEILTYPILFVVVIIGLSMALLTVNGMPFATWFTNFVFSIFTSQRKVYHKSSQAPSALTQQVRAKAVRKPQSVKATPKDGYYTAISRLSNADEPFANEFPNYKRSNEVDVEDILADPKAKSLDNYFDRAVTTNLAKYDLKQAGGNLAGTEKSSGNTEFLTPSSETIISKVGNTTPRPLDSSVQPSDVNVKSAGNLQGAENASASSKQMHIPAVEQQPQAVSIAASSDWAVQEPKVSQPEPSLSTTDAEPTQSLKQQQPTAQSGEPLGKLRLHKNPAGAGDLLSGEGVTTEQAATETSRIETQQPIQGAAAGDASSPVSLAGSAQQEAPSQETTLTGPSDLSETDEIAAVTKQLSLKPNQIVGQVCSIDGTPLQSAVVNVNNDAGILLRSVYTDMKGRFVVSTALTSGVYKLDISKKGFRFPVYQLTLDGNIVPEQRYLASN